MHAVKYSLELVFVLPPAPVHPSIHPSPPPGSVKWRRSGSRPFKSGSYLARNRLDERMQVFRNSKPHEHQSCCIATIRCFWKVGDFVTAVTNSRSLIKFDKEC